jgi:hypothetical protein
MVIQYHSNYEETVPMSDGCAQVALQANTEETFAVPGTDADKYQVRFTYTSTSNVFVRYNNTPTVPAAGTTGTETGNEYRPGSDGSKRYAKGGDVIHLITPDATAYVGIALKKLPS